MVSQSAIVSHHNLRDDHEDNTPTSQGVETIEPGLNQTLHFTEAINAQRFITHIVHVSDIHIRKGNLASSRYEEYQTQFKRLCDYIRNSPQRDSTAVIITGDLFHDKCLIGMFEMMLFLFILIILIEMSSFV
jgi:hypothetical protein